MHLLMLLLSLQLLASVPIRAVQRNHENYGSGSQRKLPELAGNDEAVPFTTQRLPGSARTPALAGKHLDVKFGCSNKALERAGGSHQRRLASSGALSTEAPQAAQCGDALCLVQALLNRRPQIYLTSNLDLEGVGILPTIESRVSIVGVCDKAKCKLDAKGSSGIFLVGLSGYLTLKDLEITGGFCNQGSAVLVTGLGANSPDAGGKLDVSNVKFANNIAKDVGGAVAVQVGGSAYITNSIFYNNKANKGGAMYIAGSAKVPPSATSSTASCSFMSCTSVSNTEFNRNQATGSGGAVYVGDTSDPECAQIGGGQLDCSTCTFVNNSAQHNGGALLVGFASSGATANTKDSAFLSNTAGGVGGDIDVQPSREGAKAAQLHAYNTRFSNSNASHGWSVEVGRASSASFTNCDFSAYITGNSTSCEGSCNISCPVDRSMRFVQDGSCMSELPPGPLCPWLPDECASPPATINPTPSTAPPPINILPPPFPILPSPAPPAPSSSSSSPPPSPAAPALESPPLPPPPPQQPLPPPPPPPAVSLPAPPPTSSGQSPPPASPPPALTNVPPSPAPPAPNNSSTFSPPVIINGTPPPKINIPSAVPPPPPPASRRSPVKGGQPPFGPPPNKSRAPPPPATKSNRPATSPPANNSSRSPSPTLKKRWIPPPPPAGSSGRGRTVVSAPSPPPPPSSSDARAPPVHKKGRQPPPPGGEGMIESAPPAPPPPPAPKKRRSPPPPSPFGSIESAPPAPPPPSSSSSSSITGDPHFLGKHGERFDFHGKPGHDYCVLSDRNVHVNMHVFHGRRRKSTFISKLGILYKDQKIVINAQAEDPIAAITRQHHHHPWKLLLNNAELTEKNATSIIADHGLTVTRGLNFAHIYVPGELDLFAKIVRATFGKRGSLKDYINFQVEQLRVSPNVHGLLGQTYQETQRTYQKLHDAKRKKRSTAAHLLVDGSESDYLTSDVLSPDCKFASFVVQERRRWSSNVKRRLLEPMQRLFFGKHPPSYQVVMECIGFGDYSLCHE